MEAVAIIPEKAAAEYQAEIAALSRELDALRQSYSVLEAKVRFLLQQRFGAKAERFNPDQLSLFDAPTPEAETEAPPTITVPEHTRPKGGRRRPPAHLPRKEVIVDLPEAQKQCACGACKRVIGAERSERYELEPAKFWVEEQVRLVYACPCCETAPVTAPAAAHPGLGQPARPYRRQQVHGCPPAEPPGRHLHPPLRGSLHHHHPGQLGDRSG